ncbi:MAG TPA: di-heme enzyme, partial [Alteromonas macleodii]|nr:di-heme enzyme [Alteromonas macleodii]
RSPFIKGFTISEDEKAALVAFLRSLTDEQFVKTHTTRKN